MPNTEYDLVLWNLTVSTGFEWFLVERDGEPSDFSVMRFEVFIVVTAKIYIFLDDAM